MMDLLGRLIVGRGLWPAVPAIVSEARRGDAVVLWNMLPRTSGADRRVVAQALDRLRPRPADVTEADVIAGDRDALDRWRTTLDRQGW